MGMNKIRRYNFVRNPDDPSADVMVETATGNFVFIGDFNEFKSEASEIIGSMKDIIADCLLVVEGKVAMSHELKTAAEDVLNNHVWERR